MHVTGSASDDALNRALDAAVLQIENQAGIFLRLTILKQHFRGVPSGLRLHAQPSDPASLLIYKNENAVSAISSAAFTYDQTEGFPRIRVVDSSAFDASSAFYAFYSAGFSTIPADILVAVFELAGLHFEFREAAAPVQLYALPFSVRSILAPYHSGAI